MQKTFFILALCCGTLLACRKSTPNRIDIYGQWQWENSVGGFTGVDTIKPSSNSLVTLTFKNDMTYTTELNGQIILHGSFQISTVNNQKVLTLNNFVQIAGLWLGNNGTTIQISNNKLHLTDYEVSEPYTHNFK